MDARKYKSEQLQNLQRSAGECVCVCVCVRNCKHAMIAKQSGNSQAMCVCVQMVFFPLSAFSSRSAPSSRSAQADFLQRRARGPDPRRTAAPRSKSARFGERMSASGRTGEGGRCPSTCHKALSRPKGPCFQIPCPYRAKKTSLKRVPAK